VTEPQAPGASNWLCSSCLGRGTKVPAATLRQGTALCEECAGGGFTVPAEDVPVAVIDGETGRVVVDVGSILRSWTHISPEPTIEP
jgi:hypothetical protein